MSPDGLVIGSSETRISLQSECSSLKAVKPFLWLVLTSLLDFISMATLASPMYRIQQLRHFLYLIYNYQRAGRFGQQGLPEGVRVALESLADRINQQIVVDCIRKTFLQER